MRVHVVSQKLTKAGIVLISVRLTALALSVVDTVELVG